VKGKEYSGVALRPRFTNIVDIALEREGLHHPTTLRHTCCAPD
jgi:hypothetical protein